MRNTKYPYLFHFNSSNVLGVVFLRPMKDFLAKEIALFNYRHCLKILPVPWTETKVPRKSSINRLSEGELMFVFLFHIT